MSNSNGNSCSLSTTSCSNIIIPKGVTGLVYIDDGSSVDSYSVYIDNGTSWDRYIPYIDNGSSFDIY